MKGKIEGNVSRTYIKQIQLKLLCISLAHFCLAFGFVCVGRNNEKAFSSALAPGILLSKNKSIKILKPNQFDHSVSIFLLRLSIDSPPGSSSSIEMRIDATIGEKNSFSCHRVIYR